MLDSGIVDVGVVKGLDGNAEAKLVLIPVHGLLNKIPLLAL